MVAHTLTQALQSLLKQTYVHGEAGVVVKSLCWRTSRKSARTQAGSQAKWDPNFLKVTKFTAVPIVINPIFMPPTDHHTCDNPGFEPRDGWRSQLAQSFTEVLFSAWNAPGRGYLISQFSAQFCGVTSVKHDGWDWMITALTSINSTSIHVITPFSP